MYAHAGRFQLSGWRGFLLLLLMAGVAAAFGGMRFGFSTTTQISDGFPSGLCSGLTVFCGIALAVGCLTLACIAKVIGGGDWRVIGRACLLAGSLSYLLAMLGAVATTADGGSWRVWVGDWSARSMVRGAAWTVVILLLLLFIEFLPDCSLKTARKNWFAVLTRLDLPLLIFVTFLAVAHQFGLSRLIRQAEFKLSPLWTGPSLAPLFYLSSVALALAILYFASWRCFAAFHKALPAGMEPVIARLLTAVVFVYLTIRLIDLMERGLIWSIFGIARANLLVLLELVLLLCGMMWIHGSEQQPREVFIGSALIIAGVIANRLNTAITALEAGTGLSYLPSWGEFLVAYSLLAAGVAGFALAVKHFSVLAETESPAA